MFQPDADEKSGSRSMYDACVLEEAREAGLYDDELAAVLCGRPPTEVVLPLPGEEPSAYAERAVGELLILYVTRWPGGSDGSGR
jgi:hypothetical protein